MLSLCLQRGGCDNGQAVVEAFGRMLKQGTVTSQYKDTLYKDILDARTMQVGTKHLQSDYSGTSE